MNNPIYNSTKKNKIPKNKSRSERLIHGKLQKEISHIAGTICEKNNKVGSFVLHDFKIYYKSGVVKKV